MRAVDDVSVLGQHNGKEDAILYPMSDQVAGTIGSDELVRQMQAIWCRTARPVGRPLMRSDPPEQFDESWIVAKGVQIRIDACLEHARLVEIARASEEP